MEQAPTGTISYMNYRPWEYLLQESFLWNVLTWEDFNGITNNHLCSQTLVELQGTL
jgi:hypothetical protein